MIRTPLQRLSSFTRHAALQKISSRNSPTLSRSTTRLSSSFAQRVYSQLSIAQGSRTTEPCYEGRRRLATAATATVSSSPSVTRRNSQQNDTVPHDGLSSVVGPTSPPLDERTLGQFWDDLVARYPDSPALVSSHEFSTVHSLDHPPYGLESLGPAGSISKDDCLRWDFREMGKYVDAVARGLLRMGLKRGDRIGVYLGNGSAYAMLQWASAKTGIILVCINPASRGPELLAALNLTSCSALFIPPSLRKVSHTQALKDLLPALVNSQPGELNEVACKSLKHVVFVDNTKLGAQGFADMLETEGLGGRDFRRVLDWNQGGVELGAGMSNDQTINIQFTSGTTGLPKGVALTHRNLLNNGRLIGECMNLRFPEPEKGWMGERLCNVPPLYHCFGIVLGNLAFWTHGACIIYASETFDPVLSLRAVLEEKCTALHGVPTMFTAQLALLDKLDKGGKVEGLDGIELDFSSLRTGIAAGSPVPDEIMRKLISRMNLSELTITYGQTETSPGTAMSKTTDPVELRCRTVGQVLPHTHLRIVDPNHELYPHEDTPSVPVNTPGELWSGGYALQPGYWENQAETDAAMFTSREGTRWMITGDQAIMDSAGFISIVGRIKDIIIRGGENLFPVVIENRSLLLPGVAACSIVGVTDPIMGEVVGAFLQRDDSEVGRALQGKELAKHITKLLSHQSAPDWVWFLGEEGVGDEYPKTASGKVRKVELREWAEDLAKRRVGRVRVP